MTSSKGKGRGDWAELMGLAAANHLEDIQPSAHSLSKKYRLTLTNHYQDDKNQYVIISTFAIAQHDIPYHTLPYHTIPYLTTPCLTITYPALPCLTMRCHAAVSLEARFLAG